ncbi:MAG: hypothetical protein JSV05_09255 [Candidatus Bathyarchaeota archaeon]|nr:MAG: hypothetical protein JSV05_09255 [Candidatus Bathyarchaeota archaeon]
MDNSITTLGRRLLVDGKQVKFRNERRKFVEFVDAVANEFPEAVSNDGTLNEPFRSLAFLVTIGQRPITSLLILQTLLEADKKLLNGKSIGKKLAEKLEISQALTTKGGNYEDRVGDLISIFVKMGILETAFSRKAGYPKEEGFRIRKSVRSEMKAFLDCFLFEWDILQRFKSLSFKESFVERFDKRLGYVIKSGTKKRKAFKIGKIMKSLLDPKIGISFEESVDLIEEIEPNLTRGMKTFEIQEMLYSTLRKRDKKAAENYRQSYPKVSSIEMSDGKIETVNYKLVKALIDKEVKLKLTRNTLDSFASTVYNVISKNPKNYKHETAVREYVYALVRSECVYVRSVSNFIKDQLASATSSLEGCRNSLESDEIAPARGLLRQFLEQISLAAIVGFGYLPFKDFRQNVDLISNLLRQEGIKKELQEEFQLNEEALTQFQRIRFLMHERENASKRSLEKMIEEANWLIDLCWRILKSFHLRRKPKPVAAEILDTITPNQVTTGYKDLDDLLNGGIPDTYAIILTSPSCDERDVLIERFLNSGMKGREITLYVTIDAKTAVTLAEKYPSNFYLILCNPEADAIVKNLPNVRKLKGVENLNDIDIALTDVLRNFDSPSKKVRRACVEVVSDALLQHHAVATRIWLTALIPKFKSRGFTTLAVMNPHMHSSQEVQAIVDLFQGEIHVYKKKTEKGLRRFLRIEKLYNQEYSQSELQLKKEKIMKLAPED